MTVTIPFRPEFKDALLEGRKTKTARTKKYGERGDQFEAFGAPFVILKVEKIRLSDIASKFFAEEGVESPEAYQKKWVVVSMSELKNKGKRNYERRHPLER